jgi:hypothetical protein
MTPDEERHFQNLLGVRVPRRYDPVGLYAALTVVILLLAFVVWVGVQLWPR